MVRHASVMICNIDTYAVKRSNQHSSSRPDTAPKTKQGGTVAALLVRLAFFRFVVRQTRVMAVTRLRPPCLAAEPPPRRPQPRRATTDAVLFRADAPDEGNRPGRAQGMGDVQITCPGLEPSRRRVYRPPAIGRDFSQDASSPHPGTGSGKWHHHRRPECARPRHSPPPQP